MVASEVRVAGQVVIPTLAAFLLFLLALWASARMPTGRTAAAAPPTRMEDWARLVRLLGATAVGGYAVFLVLVLVFYVALGGQGPGFVADALGSGAMLAFAVVVPSFLAMEALRALLRLARAGGRASSLGRTGGDDESGRRIESDSDS
jgi:hypothetical protein